MTTSAALTSLIAATPSLPPAPRDRASAAAIVLAAAAALVSYFEAPAVHTAEDRVNLLTDPGIDTVLCDILRGHAARDPWAAEALTFGGYWRCSAMLLVQGYLFAHVGPLPAAIGGFRGSDLVKGAQTLAGLEPFFKPCLGPIERLSLIGGGP